MAAVGRCTRWLNGSRVRIGGKKRGNRTVVADRHHAVANPERGGTQAVGCRDDQRRCAAGRARGRAADDCGCVAVQENSRAAAAAGGVRREAGDGVDLQWLKMARGRS
ncbi:putative radical SAM protein YgiQ [Sesbania bispinosa]|nr:putative radical SAM protein YgiQ [Sesbania bispinosa]